MSLLREDNNWRVFIAWEQSAANGIQFILSTRLYQSEDQKLHFFLLLSAFCLPLLLLPSFLLYFLGSFLDINFWSRVPSNVSNIETLLRLRGSTIRWTSKCEILRDKSQIASQAFTTGPSRSTGAFTAGATSADPQSQLGVPDGRRKCPSEDLSCSPCSVGSKKLVNQLGSSLPVPRASINVG